MLRNLKTSELLTAKGFFAKDNTDRFKEFLPTKLYDFLKASYFLNSDHSEHKLQGDWSISIDNLPGSTDKHEGYAPHVNITLRNAGLIKLDFQYYNKNNKNLIVSSCSDANASRDVIQFTTADAIAKHVDDLIKDMSALMSQTPTPKP